MEDAGKMQVTMLPSGVSSSLLGVQAYDWPSIRTLAEKGVPYRVIARHFNGLDAAKIAKRAHDHNWLTPAREKKMRKELAARQTEALEQNGEVRDPNEVMEEIWEERSNRINEKAFAIVEKALDGTPDDVAENLIVEAKDLKTIVDVGRKVTGAEHREQKDLDTGPSIAIDMGLLRSAGVSVAPTTIDV